MKKQQDTTELNEGLNRDLRKAKVRARRASKGNVRQTRVHSDVKIYTRKGKQEGYDYDG